MSTESALERLRGALWQDEQRQRDEATIQRFVARCLRGRTTPRALHMTRLERTAAAAFTPETLSALGVR